MAPAPGRGRKRKKRQPNRGSFRPVATAGPDPRRHVFTPEERRRGGLTTARRYLCTGRWHLDWLERCDRKVRDQKGGFVDGAEEGGGGGSRPGGAAGGDDALPW